MASSDPQKPLGQRLRDFINPALEDDRAKQVQSEYVSNVFDQIAENVPQIFEKEFTHFFNHVAQRSEKRPQTRNPMIVNALIAVQNPQEGEAAFSPIKKLQLPISTAFTNFAPDDIKEMPGWIKLHEVCRELDISIRLVALTGDESKGSMMPPLLVLNAAQSYSDGALENAQLYPDLPPRKADFNRRDGQAFDF
jgi:hypothetical protein